MTSIRDWKSAYESDAYSASDEQTQVAAGWTDWLCPTSQLAGKTKSFAGFLTRIVEGGKVDLGWEVAFKNTANENGNYDLVVLYENLDIKLAITMGEQLDDGKKWHVKPNGQGEAMAFSTVIQLAKWLNESVPVIIKAAFQTASTDNAALIAEAIADAKERFEVDLEFTGVWKKRFYDAEQANVWLAKNLDNEELRLLLVAMLDGVSIVGYVAA